MPLQFASVSHDHWILDVLGDHNGVNGPEFAGGALEAGGDANSVELRFIRPGKPIQNVYVESFKRMDDTNRGYRGTHVWFVSLVDAQAIIGAWRVDYNTVRPHGSLGQLTPAAYAAGTCAGQEPGCGACSAAALATTDQSPKPDGLSLSV